MLTNGTVRQIAGRLRSRKSFLTGFDAEDKEDDAIRAAADKPARIKALRAQAHAEQKAKMHVQKGNAVCTFR